MVSETDPLSSSQVVPHAGESGESGSSSNETIPPTSAATMAADNSADPLDEHFEGTLMQWVAAMLALDTSGSLTGGTATSTVVEGNVVPRKKETLSASGKLQLRVSYTSDRRAYTDVLMQ